MQEKDFVNIMKKYFYERQITALVEYCRRLDSLSRHRYDSTMTAYSFLVIRMQEEARKGIMWLCTFVSDIIGDVNHSEIPDIEGLMRDLPDFQL